MKIYRIMFTSIDEFNHTIKVKTFFDRENAIRHYKEMLKDLKEEQKELDMEDYCIDEDENSYERYLNGQAMEQSVSLWIEEDNTYDELVQELNRKKEDEKEKEYEI